MESSSILSQILKPEYVDIFDGWIGDATAREKRGLQLLGAIYKHKGRKKFRAKPPAENIHSLTFDTQSVVR
jgi:hypothetical protein